MKTLILILFLLFFTTLNISCSKKMTFSPVDDVDGMTSETSPGEGDSGGPDPTPVSPPECTLTYNEVTTPVKVLFLVDKSGSNLDDYNSSAVNDGTDPNKTWRITSINNLHNSLTSLFSFNITLFRANALNLNDGYRYGGPGGSLTRTLINGFSNNSSTFTSAMNALAADPDQGKTPYEAALAKAHDTILADIANDTVSKYSVVLVTDGQPDPNLVTKTFCGSRTCDSSNGADADIPKSIDKAREFVKAIVNIDPKRVNVNTVYYYSAGQRSSTPINILTNMADQGKGAFIEAPSNQSLDFQNVIRVPASNCP